MMFLENGIDYFAGAEGKGITDRLIAAAMEVHSQLGPGYNEAIYEEALCLELANRNIPFERQKIIKLNYKGHSIGEGRLDLLIDNQIIVELKAVEALNDIHLSQVLSYLKMTGLTLGYLINFNVRSLKFGIKRVVKHYDQEK